MVEAGAAVAEAGIVVAAGVVSEAVAVSAALVVAVPEAGERAAVGSGRGWYPWSQVDIVLQRRADLIPNLVETVKGYAKQEQTVFGDIAKARSALLSAGTPQQKIAANGQLDGALGRLLLVVENYPQLKSNENFMPPHSIAHNYRKNIAKGSQRPGKHLPQVRD